MTATAGREIEDVMRSATADTLNAQADDLAARALAETPLEFGTLRASEQYPGNDPSLTHSASADDPTAVVSFNTVYAAAQHEGEMTYYRDGQEVHWEVRQHTTPGTKAHYLEDPLKSMIPRYERTLGLAVARALAEHFGDSYRPPGL